MGSLEIRLFGQLEVKWRGMVLSRFPTRKARTLFSYLALHAEKLHAREVLAGLFWPESSDRAARKRLRTELWQMRRFLEGAESDESFVLTGNDSIGINLDADLWIDRVELEEKLGPVARAAPIVTTGEGLTSVEARQLAEAVTLYRGHLLEGCYADWCIESREHFQARLLTALEKLTRFHQQQGDWELAIRFGEAALRHEPLAEHVHRALMRCHWSTGNRTAALRQFSRCAALLEKELDVGPMPETAALHQQIRSC